MKSEAKQIRILLNKLSEEIEDDKIRKEFLKNISDNTKIVCESLRYTNNFLKELGAEVSYPTRCTNFEIDYFIKIKYLNLMLKANLSEKEKEFLIKNENPCISLIISTLKASKNKSEGLTSLYTYLHENFGIPKFTYIETIKYLIGINLIDFDSDNFNVVRLTECFVT